MRYALLGSPKNPLFQGCKSWIEACAVDKPHSVICGPFNAEDIKQAEIELGLSLGYRYILKREQLKAFKYGVINIHTGYLPWNRGAYPNVWPIVDGSPAGVTMHWMDEGVDTGAIIRQVRVKVEPWDTAKTLYDKLCGEGIGLFIKMWPALIRGQLIGTPQDLQVGSIHRKSDIEELNADMPGFRDVLNRLRARSYPGYGIEIDGHRVTVSFEEKED